VKALAIYTKDGKSYTLSAENKAIEVPADKLSEARASSIVIVSSEKDLKQLLPSKKAGDATCVSGDSKASEVLSQAYEKLGNKLLDKDDKPEDAIVALDRALELTDSKERKYAILTKLGECYGEAGYHENDDKKATELADKATEYYNKAREIASPDKKYESYLSIGDMHNEWLNDSKGAIGFYEKALELAPAGKKYEVYITLAFLSETVEKNPKKTDELYAKALEDAPAEKKHMVYSAMAENFMIYRHQKDKGVDYYKKALEVAPAEEKYHAYFYIGQAYNEIKDTKKALENS